MTKLQTIFYAGVFVSVSGAAAHGLEKTEETVGKHKFVTVTVDLHHDNLQQYWRNPITGQAYGSIYSLRNALHAKNQRLAFAINGGIFTKEQTPLGLYIEAGKQQAPLNLVAPVNAKGNFSLVPNGVFYIAKQRAQVLSTAEYARNKTQYQPDYAAQSGPMLLIDGAYHPKFIKDSPSVKIRGGVCAQEHLVYFVVSETLINFYDFASYFKNRLGCDQALYLDGTLTQIFYQGRYYGAPFWKVRDYVSIFAVGVNNDQ